MDRIEKHPDTLPWDNEIGDYPQWTSSGTHYLKAPDGAVSYTMNQLT